MVKHICAINFHETKKDPEGVLSLYCFLLCTRGTIVLDIPCTNVQNTQMNLKDKTVELLEQTTETKKEIAINCNVSYRWLSYLSSNEDRGFDVNQVQRVYDYLTNHSPK